MSFVGDHEESRSGDGDPAFRDYVLARGTALLRMAVMLTGNRADAEDLVQAALAKTYLAWGKINDRAALDAYVRRAMVNTHISWWRRRKLEDLVQRRRLTRARLADDGQRASLPEFEADAVDRADFADVAAEQHAFRQRISLDQIADSHDDGWVAGLAGLGFGADSVNVCGTAADDVFGADAGRLMIGGHRRKLRLLGSAVVDDERAARRERASRLKVRQ